MNFFDPRNSWKDLTHLSPEQGKVYLRRISADFLYDHFIGIDEEGRYMYVIKLQNKPETDKEQPSVSGCFSSIELIAQKWCFCLRLKDSREWAIFKLTCQVLIQTLEKKFSTDADYVIHQLSSTLKKFCAFFKKKQSVLTRNVAAGLIGELLFLKNYVVPKTGWENALSCWTGPTGAPQDFVVENTVIEIKTTEAAHKNIVTISNSEQLAPHDTQGYLFVLALSSGTVSSNDSISLNSLVSEIETDMYDATGDVSMLHVYLFQLGYYQDAKEANRPYLILESTFYTLNDDFPKITTEMLPCGISSVKYTVDLNFCKKFITLPPWINHE